MPDQKDEVLMLAYKDRRDPEAMVALFRRYRRDLYEFLWHRTRSPSRAEDLVQEVFAALIEGADRYRPTGSFKSYLYRIAANLSSKEWRKERRLVPLEAEPAAREPSGAAEGGGDRAKVRAALEALEPEQREAILLREYQGLSYEEIASTLDLPVGTVKSRIARGKLSLRAALCAVAG
jgi:RNA polymerase sigma-70 factor (ECF subfamily)